MLNDAVYSDPRRRCAAHMAAHAVTDDKQVAVGCVQFPAMTVLLRLAHITDYALGEYLAFVS